MNISILFACILVGVALQYLGFGRKMIPIAPWLSPIFLLYFSHALPPEIGLPLIGLAIYVSALLAYRGVVPVPGASYPLVIAVLSLPSALPYVADRLLYTHLPGFVAALIFPVTWVVAEFVGARTSPYSSWGSIAYTQWSDLPLIQLASVTGLWGISFLVAWFGSTVNWALENQFDWSSIQAGVIAYVLAWVAVMVAGGLRLAFAKAGRTIRTAVIGWPNGLVERSTFMQALQPGPLSEADRSALQKIFGVVQDYFIEASRREAMAGSKIMVWPEACVMVFKCDEPAFIRRAEQLSASEGVSVVMGLVSIIEGVRPQIENKAVLVDPSKGVVYSYLKRYPVPGWEAQISVKSDGALPTYDSAYGRLGSAVCFDMDFPHFIRQAGKSGLDLLLVPASDWEEIKDLHHILASVRAVENGFAMVRAARWGVSGAVDVFGRTLARTDGFAAAPDVTVAQVPLGSVPTLYARLGDWFAWICAAGLAAITVGSLLSLI